MAGHKDALALGQEVTHEVCDGMCLASARRALHQDSIIALDPSGNLQLFLVGFFGKQNVHTLTANSCKLLLNRGFVGVFRNINFSALNDISNRRRNLSGFLNVLNDLLNGFQGSIHALPQNIAGIAIHQETFFFLPVIRDAIFGINTF